MKKFLLLFAMIITVIATVFSGCGVYNPATGTPGTPGGEKPSKPGVEEEGYAYTVKVAFGNNYFTDLDGVSARWTGEGTIVTSAFEAGVATKKLDGDYSVTLVGLPEKYVYDQNAYTASVDDRDITIRIYEITRPQNKGSDWYTDAIEIKDTGVFATTLQNSKSSIRFIFAPTKDGEYSIESWCSVTDNNINPMLRAHQGTRFFVMDNLFVEYDDGGYSGSYTKNFKYVMTFDKSNFSQSGGGQATYQFSISATTKLEYPVQITFAILRTGEFSLGIGDEDVAIPQEQFKRFAPESNRPPVLAAKNNVFDEKDCELRDGYWWYNVDGQGDWRRLYAYITKASPAYTSPLTRVEDYQNALSVPIYNADGSYKMKSYKYFIRGTEATVQTEYPLPPEGWEVDGYANHANSDGVYPVTDELKIFLQLFAEKEMLFFDGEGIVDSAGYDAFEGSQWLFDCCYYQ